MTQLVIKVKYSCIICHEEFSTNNLIRHYTRCKEKGCKCKPFKKNISPNSLTCKFCNKVLETERSYFQHIIKCSKNKDRIYENGMKGKIPYNKGKTKETLLSLKNAANSLKLRYKNGLTPNGCFSSKFHGSEKHLISCRKNGGYRENAGRSKKFKVYDSFGKLTTLQSSFELNCSEILAELGINWIRPKAVKYDNRNYFADFYLPDYDIWLDPKNDYKAKLDEEKIRKVKEQNGINLFVLLEHQISKQYINSILL